jgi:hypoxanthine phosphoribosyltransferase
MPRLPELDQVLIDEARIAARVRELGRELASDLQRDVQQSGTDRIVLIPILTGAVVFVADLIRHMPLKLSLGVVAVSSYPGRTIESKGAAVRGELPGDLSGKHVVIVDDILDSGQTLALIRDVVMEQKPATLRICVMLRKDVPRRVAVDVDYVGFDIPDAFVVGYGLDYDGFYRNYPQIGTIRLG